MTVHPLTRYATLNAHEHAKYMNKVGEYVPRST